MFAPVGCSSPGGHLSNSGFTVQSVAWQVLLLGLCVLVTTLYAETDAACMCHSPGVPKHLVCSPSTCAEDSGNAAGLLDQA